MELAVFAKKRTSKEGKGFYSYLGKLHKKNGEEITVTIKFREEAGQPKPEKCPLYIEVDKVNANLANRTYVDEATGEVRYSYTLWVSEWKPGREYVDNSLDDYE